jgi:hypothetical protein
MVSGRIGDGAISALKAIRKLGYRGIVLDFSRGGPDEIHTRLLVEGAALGGVVGVNGTLMATVNVVVAGRRVGVNDFGDELGLLFLLRVVLCASAGELDKLDAGRAYGVGPVEGTLGLGDAAGNLVEEVGGGDGAVKRSDEVRWERVEGSGEKENLVLLPVKVHLVGIG